MGSGFGPGLGIGPRPRPRSLVCPGRKGVVYPVLRRWVTFFCGGRGNDVAHPITVTVTDVRLRPPIANSEAEAEAPDTSSSAFIRLPTGIDMASRLQAFHQALL